MALLRKEDIEKIQDLDHVDIEVPEWGGTVRIREMTGSERDLYEADIYKIVNGKPEIIRENFRAKLVARTLVGESGNRLFTDKEIVLLGKKNARALNHVYEIAQSLNGLSVEEADDIEKN